MILFTQSTAVLQKYLNDELKTLCLLQFFLEVAQNSVSIPWVFHVQRNPRVFQVFQVCGHRAWTEINRQLRQHKPSERWNWRNASDKLRIPASWPHLWSTGRHGLTCAASVCWARKRIYHRRSKWTAAHRGACSHASSTYSTSWMLSHTTGTCMDAHLFNRHDHLINNFIHYKYHITAIIITNTESVQCLI